MTAAIVVFITTAVLVLYVVIIYPLLLQIWPGQRKYRAAAEPQSYRTVTVILPVRNGEKWIGAKLDSIFALDYPQELLQVIVVSDNSTDTTESIAASYGNRVLLLRNPKSGKASAINYALTYSTGEILFMTDVRQAIDRDALRILVGCFDDPEIGVASGELIIRKSDSTEEENVGLYWEYEKSIRRRHSNIDSVIGATGAIYAMRRELARPLPESTLLDDVQLPMGAFFEGYRVLFVEPARAYDIPTALDKEFDRKVRTIAGVYQLIKHYPELLGPRNRMWFHFMSHKVGRLLLPFLLILLLMSSFFLPAPWALIAVAGQLGFYTVAALDSIIPQSPIKKASSLARTFVVLMLAALCATKILFRPTQSLWKTAG